MFSTRLSIIEETCHNVFYPAVNHWGDLPAIMFSTQLSIIEETCRNVFYPAVNHWGDLS